jgi:D-glycero-D-manno-heptose 1,7-bisphosphate phosphatase
MALKAAFLDRDGVINVDHGYVHKVEDFVFIPGVFEALRRLQAAEYLLIVVTNQSGIARGYFTQAQFHTLTAWMTAQLAAEGITLTAVYHCPHLPDAPIEAYRRNCNCRKPAPGMIQAACRDWIIDPAASVLFGDHLRDIQAGQDAGLSHCILVGPESDQPSLRSAVDQFLEAVSGRIDASD